MSDESEIIACRPVSLPPHLLVDAAVTAVRENPANAVRVENLPAGVLSPQRIAVMVQKYWGAGGVKLGVTFLDTQDSTLKNKIIAYMNRWSHYGNVTFSESSQGQVRIARTPGQGYYSYLGTDVLSIPTNQPTMNLDSFTLQTPDSEYARVVQHETGHTLGFPHEHMRREIVSNIDPAKAYAYFARYDGWDQQTVREQVLTPLDEASIMATPRADGSSIMAYQLPGSIMRDGVAVPGGTDIDPTDGAFCLKIYPNAATPPVPPPPGTGPTIEAVIATLDTALNAYAAQYPRRYAGLIRNSEPGIAKALRALWHG